MASASSLNLSSNLPCSSSSCCGWDVFLSFRGEDTRYNFTGHLYTALTKAGIKTFKDDPSLRGGDEISPTLMEAIQESNTYIVVLSINYADSKWCLDELVEILKCSKATGRSVHPVFYHVLPSDVRHQLDSFGKALDKSRVTDAEKVGNWRTALTEVANFSGHQIDKDRDESTIIERIVSEVRLKVNPKNLKVAKHPVGLQSRVQSIKRLLHSVSGGVYCIGIYGMAGVGKTTTAKAVYNDILHHFEGTSFMENVGEYSKQLSGQVCLQKQLLWDILQIKEEIYAVANGISVIETRLSSKKVLIILDDVINANQLDWLGDWIQFASGSRIIVTTRDEGVLDAFPNCERLCIEELAYDESRELFSLHAFHRPVPENDFKDISEKVLSCARGLPLALVVFGSALFKKPEIEWKRFIEKLQKIPNREIQQKLVLSFDALDDVHLKGIFLDIACFFIGLRKARVVRILETYYESVEYDINTLIQKSLITINKHNEMRMHDLLRDMGREISRKNFLDEPGRQSRLWKGEDIYHVLKRYKGTEAIEGIVHHDDSYHEKLREVPLEAKTFERMHRLRFLYIKDINLTGSFDQTFENLRWLCWSKCPLLCLPSDFHPEKLGMLELPNSKLITLWENTMVLEKLKILDLSGSRDLCTSPYFSGLPELETLILRGCENLEEVDTSIGSLYRLVSLDLEHCRNLRSLPSSIRDLRALERLDIDSCLNLQDLPMELGNIESLIELRASHLTVSKLPSSIGCLSKLVVLDLRGNQMLETLPDTICNLRALKVLDVNNCRKLQDLPMELGNIKSLTQLRASLVAVSKLPSSIGCLSKLDVLDLSGNQMLETLPDTICNLRALKILDVAGCHKLQDLPMELGNIESLIELRASGLAVSKLPSSIGCLSKLLVLDLRGNQMLETLPDTICNMRALKVLKVDSCHKLQDLPMELGKIESLLELRASHLTVSKLPSSIGYLSKLVVLDLSGNQMLDTLPDTICNLRAVKVLDVDSCLNLQDLPMELGNIESLTQLRASRLTVSKLPSSIGGLSKLEVLDLRDNRMLETLPDTICNLRALQVLDVDGCLNLQELPEELGRIESLRDLRAGGTKLKRTFLIPLAIYPGVKCSRCG